MTKPKSKCTPIHTHAYTHTHTHSNTHAGDKVLLDQALDDRVQLALLALLGQLRFDLT